MTHKPIVLRGALGLDPSCWFHKMRGPERCLTLEAIARIVMRNGPAENDGCKRGAGVPLGMVLANMEGRRSLRRRLWTNERAFENPDACTFNLSPYLATTSDKRKKRVEKHRVA